MSARSEHRHLIFWFWLFVLLALAFGNGARIGEAATLWVPPAEGMSASKVGRWAATESGNATFTFALPDDISAFLGAKVVLLPSADETVTYKAHLALSQEGMGHDYYTDDALVGEPVELLAEQVTEVDISGLIPHQDMLAPGQDYLTVRFTAEGFENREVSSAAKVLGLRLEYLVADVAAADRAEQESGSNANSKSSTSYTASYTALPARSASSSSSADSAAEAAKSMLAIQTRIRQSDARATVGGAALDRSAKAALANTKFNVQGDIRISSPFAGIHGWALGTTGNSFAGTGFFFIEDQNPPGALRFTIDQNTGLVSAGDLIANKLGIGTLPDASYTLKSSGNARFEGLNGGRFEFGTPGGWPGIIGFSPNGYRREIALHNNFMWILAGDSSTAPDATHGITIRNNGDVGIGTATPNAKLTVVGRTKTGVLEITGGSDLSERFQVDAPQDGIALIPGMVVSIDPDAPGALEVSRESYDRKVAGVISGAGGVNPGMLMGQEGTLADGQNPVALTGRVYCLADAGQGGIQPGDLLTTSETPGHAMRVTDYSRAQGAILGKAMTDLDKGRGLVLVLVALQ